jgi:membrane protein
MSKKSESKKRITDLTWSERWILIKDTIGEFTIDKGLFHGAALSFYTIFAMVPIIYLAVSTFGFFIGQSTILGIVRQILTEQVGVEDVSGIMDFLISIDFAKDNFFLRNIGIIALLISSTAIFISLQYSVNFFYDIERIFTSKRKQFYSNLLSRVLSFGFLAFFGAVIIVTYFTQLILISFGHQLLGETSYFSAVSLEVLRHVVGVLSKVLIFSFVLKYLHDGIVSWRLAWVGGFVTAVLLHLGQLIIQYYLSHFFFAKDGGLAGALLVLLGYMYYSSQMIFIGAKFTAVYGRMVGEPIRVKESKKAEFVHLEPEEKQVIVEKVRKEAKSKEK